MGGKNQTSTSNSTQSYTPAAQAQLQSIWNQVQGVASTPYQAFTGQMTAGLDPTQQAGINTINSAQGTAQPYYDQATQYANQAAAPISAAQIQNYQSPYTQQVVNAAQNQFNDSNAQQFQQVRGNSALQGALGGSREAVAEAETARQQKLAQDPTIAGLYNQGYTQALGAAQQDRSAQAQAAYSLGSLGSAAQNTAIQGGQSQLGAGAVAQGTTQAGLSAAYQQYLQQQAFPYQQAQFLASYGLPAATAQGGTQSGASETTQPGPSPWGQVAGVGLAAASFLKDGGRVKGYASGGSPMGADNFILVPSYVPQANSPQSQAPKIAPMQQASFKPQQAMAGPSAQTIAGGLGGLGSLFNGGNTDQGTIGGTNPFGGSDSAIYSSGGSVSPSPYPGIAQGYDVGGNVDVPDFSSRWSDVDAANNDFNRPAADASPYPILNADTLGLGKPVDWSPAQQNAPALIASGATPQTIQAAGLPPQITNPDGQSPDNSAMSFAGGQPVSAIPVAAPDDSSTMDLSAQSKQPQDKSSSGLFGLGLSKETRMGLLSAGLGALASRSPFALNAIGEGGLHGVNTYNQLTKQAEDKALQKTKVDLEAKKLAQTADQFSKTFGLHQQQFGETQRQRRTEELKPIKIGTDVTGKDIYAVRDPNSGSFKVLDQNGNFVKQDGDVPSSAVPSGATANTPAVAPVEVRAAAEPGSPRARNEDFMADLAKKNPGYAQQVKAAADYMLDPNKTFSMRNNVRDQFLRNVYQYDPTYDSTTYPARSKAVSGFASGPLANQIRSFDVTISHLSTLEDLTKNLDNTQSPAYNKVANFFKEQFGKEAPGNFNAAKSIVADEIAKGIIGGQNAQADRQDLQDRLKAAGSPEQLAGVVRTFKQLLGGQLHGLKKQYEDTTKLHNFDDRLTPSTREEILKAENYSKPKTIDGGGGQPQGFTGRTASGPNGQKLRETSDGKWVQ